MSTNRVGLKKEGDVVDFSVSSVSTTPSPTLQIQSLTFPKLMDIKERKQERTGKYLLHLYCYGVRALAISGFQRYLRQKKKKN